MLYLSAKRVLVNDKFRPKFATLKGFFKEIVLFKSN